MSAGAATSVWAAPTSELDGRGGLYLKAGGVARVTPPEADHGVAAYAVDPERAAALWTLSERLTAGSVQNRRLGTDMTLDVSR